MIRFATLIFLIFIFTSWSSHGRELVYSGVIDSHKSRVERLLKYQEGQDIKVRQADQISKLLMKTKFYESVSVFSLKGSKLQIRAVPIREISSVVVRGNNRYSRSRLMEASGLREGQKFDQRAAIEGGEKIKAFYGNSGFFNAVIEIDVRAIDSRKMSVIYRVKEGPACKIKGIDFTSVNKTLNKKLSTRYQFYLSKRLSDANVEDVRESLNAYLVANDFLSSKIEGPTATYNKEKTESVISFNITEPYSFEFVFKGIEKGQDFYKRPGLFRFQEVPKSKRFLPSKAEILRAIHKEDEDTYMIDPESTMGARIKQYFLDHGYPKVKVESETKLKKKRFLKSLVFKIAPGPKVKVKKWSILGRISRSEDYYSDFIVDNSSTLMQNGFFHREGFELGQKNLVTALKNQGFLRAKIQSSRVEYTGDQGESAVISVTLDEGPLTQIRKITFVGNKDYSDLQLAKVFDLKSNSPLRLNELEQSIEKLKQFYFKKGYLEMQVLGTGQDTVQYNQKGTQANITIRVAEGPKVIAKTILVEGNDFTDEDVVLRSLSFDKGDVLTPEKIESSIARINRMGIFSRVSIQFLEEGTPISQRTVLISVVERDPGALRFGAGVNSQRELTARAFTGVSYNNLFGTARGVSLLGEISSNIADINYLEHRVSAGYLEPFLFNTQVRGRLNLTRSDEVFNVDEDQGLVSILTKDALDILLEQQLSKRTTFTWTLLSLESRTSRERDGRCENEGTPEENCLDEFQQVATIGPVIDYDLRNNPFLPSAGSYSRLAIDYSAPALGSSDGIEFARFDGLFRYYIPFKGRLVWANEVRSGYLTNLSQAEVSGVPASYAFFLGGYSTVRGYDFTQERNRIPKGDGENIGNRRTFLPVTSATDLLIKSDSHYYMLKTELRFPMSEDLGGVVFYDGGSVLVSGFDFLDPYRDAAGFGIRYNTPVGPAALDIGFKLDRQPDEDAFDIHFSISSF
ncbi:MAG: POTRA domain-containing protein [Pseudomonadota bacterium]